MRLTTNSNKLRTTMEKIRVGVSACLLGAEVRWNCGHKHERDLMEMLGRWFAWVPVCPEEELGLGVPREPLRLEGDPVAPRLLFRDTRMERVEVRGGATAPPDRSGVGAFARVLLGRQPLLPVEEETRLHDARLRETFIEQVFAYWRRLDAEEPMRSHHD